MQKYLQNFGYLPSPDPNSNSLIQIDDRQRRTAIKAMQKYFHLPQTGEFDRRTLEMMSRPRCGLPDVIHPVGGRHQRRHDVKKEFYGPKWEKSLVTWK